MRAEDVFADSQGALGKVCRKLGLDASDSLKTPTWNGSPLQEIYPWGTIRKATPAANLATAQELSDAERAQIREHTWQYLEVFDYNHFI